MTTNYTLILQSYFSEIVLIQKELLIPNSEWLYQTAIFSLSLM
jgi:hypothetical protein